MIFKLVTANPHVITYGVCIKREKSSTDHRLESGATLVQPALSLDRLNTGGDIVRGIVDAQAYRVRAHVLSGMRT